MVRWHKSSKYGLWIEMEIKSTVIINQKAQWKWKMLRSCGLPNIKSSSWALLRANTAIRHRPPLVTMSCTVPVFRIIKFAGAKNMRLQYQWIVLLSFPFSRECTYVDTIRGSLNSNTKFSQSQGFVTYTNQHLRSDWRNFRCHQVPADPEISSAENLWKNRKIKLHMHMTLSTSNIRVRQNNESF